MSRCGCDGPCGCSLQAGPGATVSGSGSPTDPWIISSAATAPAIGPGLTGTGAAATPIKANVSTWTWPCTQTSSASKIYVNPTTGALEGEPPYHTYGENFSEIRLYPSPLVPVPADTTVDTFSKIFVNPDPCRAMNLYTEQELDVDVTLPPGGRAEVGMSNDGMWTLTNAGSSTVTEQHIQTTKSFIGQSNIPPGGSATRTLIVALGRGLAGATYTRIQVVLRALWLPASV